MTVLDQLALEEVGVPTPPGLHLGPVQRLCLELIADRAPLASDLLGSYIHSWRRDAGGIGHPAEQICQGCEDEGKRMGRRLRELGLVRHSDKRGGWYTLHFGLPPAPAPEPLTVECPVCEGCGYEVGHEDACNEWNGCVCSGVQIPCGTCGGAGEVAAPHSPAYDDIPF